MKNRKFDSALRNERIDRSASKEKKICRFKKSGIKYIDYKNPDFLYQFINDSGKILPRRITGNTSSIAHRTHIKILIDKALNNYN